MNPPGTQQEVIAGHLDAARCFAPSLILLFVLTSAFPTIVQQQETLAVWVWGNLNICRHTRVRAHTHTHRAGSHNIRQYVAWITFCCACFFGHAGVIVHRVLLYNMKPAYTSSLCKDIVNRKRTCNTTDVSTNVAADGPVIMPPIDHSTSLRRERYVKLVCIVWNFLSLHQPLTFSLTSSSAGKKHSDQFCSVINWRKHYTNVCSQVSFITQIKQWELWIIKTHICRSTRINMHISLSLWGLTLTVIHIPSFKP